MNENALYIWKRLKTAGMTDAGAAALMGNLQAESALIPTNLQNCYNQSLGLTDEQYTAAVDDGSYTNFVHDCAGYGLAQWTYWTRKQGLLDFARSAGKSIGDLDMQLDFLLHELKNSYAGVWEILCCADTIRTASDAVMCRFENPADQSERAKAYRAGLGKDLLDTVRKAADCIAAEGSDSPGKSVSELAAEVIAGQWGNGAERRERLTAAGYDYEAVQGEVNRVLSGKSETRMYKVKWGDNLTWIAKRFNTTVGEIVRLNGIEDPDMIFVGQVLKV